MPAARIASLLPSATEIVAGLGLADRLVGVTHECDTPPEVRALPKLTRSLLPPSLPSREIDRAVSASLRGDAHTVYELDAELLRRLEPDVVLTQALCDVCAVPYDAVEGAVCTMPRSAAIVSLDPEDLEGIFTCIERAAQALGVPERGAALAGGLREELAAVRALVAPRAGTRPSVFLCEWLDPLFCGGHWVPEMVEAAGGRDVFGRPGEPSRRIAWEELATADPDVIVLAPCGFDAEETVRRFPEFTNAYPDWQDLRAVREGRLFAVDANGHFSRPGPRVVQGVRILAAALWGGPVAGALPPGSLYRRTPAGEWKRLA
jgi:iron complex transport system substrate-binding protein